MAYHGQSSLSSFEDSSLDFGASGVLAVIRFTADSSLECGNGCGGSIWINVIPMHGIAIYVSTLT